MEGAEVLHGLSHSEESPGPTDTQDQSGEGRVSHGN